MDHVPGRANCAAAADSGIMIAKILPNMDTEMVLLLVFLLVPVFVGAWLTAALCRLRSRRGKPVAAETVFAGSLVVPILAAVIGTCIDADCWSTRNKGPGAIFMVLLLGLLW